MKNIEYIKKLKKELFAAGLSVILAAVALGSSTYAWYVANTSVKGTTSTISAKANGIVLQIVAGNKPEHGSNTSTIASNEGHEISPASTNNISKWYVPATWEGMNVNTYSSPEIDADGRYTVQKKNFYAYTVSEYTLYTVNSTGLADVYLDNSTINGPVTITASDGASQEWFDKIKGSIRVGIAINDELKVVYAPIIMNSPWAILITRIRPKVMASPRDASNIIEDKLNPLNRRFMKCLLFVVYSSGCTPAFTAQS